MYRMGGGSVCNKTWHTMWTSSACSMLFTLSNIVDSFAADGSVKSIACLKGHVV